MSLELMLGEVGGALLGLLAGTVAVRMVWAIVNGELYGIALQYMLGIGG